MYNKKEKIILFIILLGGLILPIIIEIQNDDDMTKVGDFQSDSVVSRDYWDNNFFNIAKMGTYWYIVDKNDTYPKIYRTDDWSSFTAVFTGGYIKGTYTDVGILKLRDGWLYYAFIEDNGSIDRIRVYRSDTGASGDWDVYATSTEDRSIALYDMIWVDNAENSWANEPFLLGFGLDSSSAWTGQTLDVFVYSGTTGLSYGCLEIPGLAGSGAIPLITTGYSYTNNNGHEVYVFASKYRGASAGGIHSWCGETSGFNDNETPEVLTILPASGSVGTPLQALLYGPLLLASNQAFIQSGNVWGLVTTLGGIEPPCPLWDYDTVSKQYFIKWFAFQSTATNVVIYKFAGGLYKIQDLTITNGWTVGRCGWNDRFDVGDEDGDHDRTLYVLSNSTFSACVNLTSDSNLAVSRKVIFEHETTSLDDTLCYMFYDDSDVPIIFGQLSTFKELKHDSPYYYKITLNSPAERDLKVRVGIEFTTRTVKQIINHILAQKCYFLYGYNITTPDSTTYTVDFTGALVEDVFDWVAKVTGYVLYWEPFGAVHLDDGTTDHSPVITVTDDEISVTSVIREGKSVSGVHLYGAPRVSTQTVYEALSLGTGITALHPTEYSQSYPNVDSQSELEKLADVILATRDSNVKRIKGRIQGKGPLIPGFIVEVTSTELDITAIDYIIITSKYYEEGDFCKVTMDNIIYHGSLETKFISPNLNYQAINKVAKLVDSEGMMIYEGGDHSGKGIIEEVTVAAGTNLQVLYLKSDGEYGIADASVAGTMPCSVLALESTTGSSRKVLRYGIARDDTWAWTTVGAKLYVSETSGALTQTAPTTSAAMVQVVGIVKSADSIFFNPDMTVILLT